MTEESLKQVSETLGAARSRRRLLKAMAGGLAGAAAAVVFPRAVRNARADQFQVEATVHNQSSWPMQLADMGLPWGNWVEVPQDVTLSASPAPRR